MQLKEHTFYITGSGLHFHTSLWSTTHNDDVMGSHDDELGLSDVGRHFLAGIMKHSDPITAFSCSTVNSYKR